MRILQISCSYFPGKIGGTEVYVHSLSRELVSRGHQVFISYVGEFFEEKGPKTRAKEYTFDGLPVFVIEKNIFGLETRQLYFDTEERVSLLFKDYLVSVRPDIVCFNNFSPTDVIAQMKIAKEMKLPVIFTYHAPMLTCGRGDMLYLGKTICKGKIIYHRCLACAQTRYGIPFPLALAWAYAPKKIAEYLSVFISAAKLRGSLFTWLQLPWLVHKRVESYRSGFKMIDRFVAVCLWAYDLLAENGVPRDKITLSRQGISQMPAIAAVKEQQRDGLRLGYCGRILPQKGLDVLLEAFGLLPREYKIELYIYGPSDDDKYYARLCKKISQDRRVQVCGVLEEKVKFLALSKLDVLVIPSRCLETGPLVLMEAWAVGTAVIGANAGSIAEQINDGIGGLLFEMEDAKDLARVIARIYNEPDLLTKLRANIPRVRTAKDVGDDMENLYRSLL